MRRIIPHHGRHRIAHGPARKLLVNGTQVLILEYSLDVFLQHLWNDATSDGPEKYQTTITDVIDFGHAVVLWMSMIDEQEEEEKERERERKRRERDGWMFGE